MSLANESQQSRALRVLIVEDSRDDAALLERELRRGGYDVAAERVETAVAMRAALEHAPWDIVLSDYALPSFSAPAALEVLQDSPFDLPFIIISGAIGEEVAVENMKAGAHDYLMKGNLTRLVSAVQRELASAERRRQHQRDELLLKDSEAKFRSIFNQAAAGVARVAIDGTWLAVNQKLCDIVGYSEEELASKTFQEITHPDDLQSDLTYHEQLLRGEIPTFSLEKRCVKKNGEIVWINLTVSLVRDRLNEPDCFIFIVENITTRKQAEGEKDRLLAAIEQSGEAITITDSEGTIEYVNPAFERISGYTVQEVLGRNPRILKSGQHNAAFYQKMWDVLTDGQIWRGHFINKRKDGTFYEEEATISPVRDTQGNVVNYVSIALDMTHEMELQAQMRQAQKMEAVGQLAGGMAHDLNNILQAVFGHCDIMLYRMSEEDALRQHILQITKSVDRAADLIRQLMAFSRLQVIRPTVLDLNAVITNATEMLQRLIGEDIAVFTQLAPDLCRIKADTGGLEQVIMNLFVNARDAMPEGGRLIVGTSNITLDQGSADAISDATPGEFVCLSVSDTGCGMSEETLEHIFEPFFTTKGIGEGTGLGMATVYGIVKQNDGFFDVLSALGEGTTFKLYLPGHTAAAEVPVAKPPVPDFHGTETILLAEDEAAVRTPGQASLEGLGYTVLTAETAEEALRLVAEHSGKIHLLITDVIMPGMNGRDLANQLIEQRPDIKCILMSGYPANIIGHQGMLDERMDFLAKPFKRVQIARVVREVLDRRCLNSKE